MCNGTEMIATLSFCYLGKNGKLRQSRTYKTPALFERVIRT